MLGCGCSSESSVLVAKSQRVPGMGLASPKSNLRQAGGE